MLRNKKINLAVLGISDGNGHPYSWSSIINGFNDKYLDNCPFPIIVEYLREKSFPSNKIKNVEVTHVWTQDTDVSKNIAQIAKIKNIENDYKNLIDKVDGILLARDDFENHYEISLPFLRAGIPIYIDKPIATNIKDLKRIYDEQKYIGQIFSCSAIRFASEFNLDKSYLDKFGGIIKIIAIAPKDWSHYSIHIIDPVLKLFNLFGDYKILSVEKYNHYGRSIEVKWNNSFNTEFITTGEMSTEISIEIIGNYKAEKLIFKDPFNAFKNALEEFISGIREGNEKITLKELHSIVKIIEEGNNIG